MSKRASKRQEGRLARESFSLNAKCKCGHRLGVHTALGHTKADQQMPACTVIDCECAGFVDGGRRGEIRR